MRRLKALFIIISLVTASNSVIAQVPEQVLSERQKAAEILKKLAEKNYLELGFASPKEAQEIDIGQPLREFTVRLDELKEYKTGSDPLTLLRGGDEFTFPVTVRKETKSSFTVAKTGEKWSPVSFGSPNRTKLIMTVLNESIAEKRPVESFFLVKVPSLYYFFLGYREDGKLYFIPLVDDKPLGFSAGKPLPAEAAFEALAFLASKQKFPENNPDREKTSDNK